MPDPLFSAEPSTVVEQLARVLALLELSKHPGWQELMNLVRWEMGDAVRTCLDPLKDELKERLPAMGEARAWTQASQWTKTWQAELDSLRGELALEERAAEAARPDSYVGPALEEQWHQKRD